MPPPDRRPNIGQDSNQAGAFRRVASIIVFLKICSFVTDEAKQVVASKEKIFL